jgi:hypothetical protein
MALFMLQLTQKFCSTAAGVAPKLKTSCGAERHNSSFSRKRQNAPDNDEQLVIRGTFGRGVMTGMRLSRLI